VVSLWSTGRIHNFLEEGTGRDRLRLILNRYKKVPGFNDEDIQQVTNCKVLWKLPNAFQVISPSIDHGTPVVLHDGPEISRSYRGLARTLAEGGPDLVYVPEGAPNRPRGTLNLSPVRGGY
jgi:septum formation inhibitor-activating ATPase MinD